jgi:predicted Zn-dependent protease
MLRLNLTRRGLIVASALAAFAFPMLAGSSPATGKKDFTPFMSSKKEKQIGASEHPKILQEFGGAYSDDAKAGYVATIGGRMVANSELARENFTFTLLNSRVNNAFALPGGYVYITRQLLGLMNDEAQLASVLGHETGHVTDRHSAKRYNSQMFGTIGALLVGVLTGSGELANAIGQASQAYTLSYSRNQEFKADELGLRYLSRAGYDPYGAADMLTALGSQTSLESRLAGRGETEAVPSWARTHPLTQDRVTRASQLAEKTGSARGALPRNRDAFLAAIDGMVVDDTADQGFIRGRTFTHPKLLFTFTVPQGYALDNGDAAVSAVGPQDAGAQFSGAAFQQNQPLAQYVAAVWQAVAGKSGVPMNAPQAATINGMEAAITATRVQQSNGAAMDVAIVAYRFSPTNVYHFLVVTPAQLSAQLDGGLREMVNSFRPIAQADAATLKERRIRIVTVQPGDTVENMAQRMAYSDAPADRFRVLNGIPAGASLQPGQKVKLITLAP